jgi:molecular chaperone GrpE
MTEHAASDISGRPAHPPGSAGPESPPRAPSERDGAAAGQVAGVAPDAGEGAAPAGRPAQPGTADNSGAPDGSAESGPSTAELEDRWRRVAADLDNLRKRYAREVGTARSDERELVASSFLPVIDNIDRALEHAGADPEAVAEGVRAVREQALAVLAGLGYHRDDAAGVPFDPGRHEVVGVVGAQGAGVAPGSVASVLRPGYGGTGRQLRPAAVTVAQASED